MLNLQRLIDNFKLSIAENTVGGGPERSVNFIKLCLLTYIFIYLLTVCWWVWSDTEVGEHRRTNGRDGELGGTDERPQRHHSARISVLTAILARWRSSSPTRHNPVFSVPVSALAVISRHRRTEDFTTEEVRLDRSGNFPKGGRARGLGPNFPPVGSRAHKWGIEPEANC